MHQGYSTPFENQSQLLLYKSISSLASYCAYHDTHKMVRVIFLSAELFPIVLFLLSIFHRKILNESETK